MIHSYLNHIKTFIINSKNNSNYLFIFFYNLNNAKLHSNIIIINKLFINYKFYK